MSDWARTGSAIDLAGGRLHALATLGGRLVLATAEALFVATLEGEVEWRAPLPGGRRGFLLCVLDDLVLLVGGHDATGSHDGRTFALDANAGGWSERRPLPAAHAAATAAVARARVHVLGGRDVHATHHVYEPAADRWDEAPALPRHRTGGAAAAAGGSLHLVGGEAQAREHDAYDLERGEWRTETPLPSPRPVAGAAVQGVRPVVLLNSPAGGEPQALLPYDPATGAWGTPHPLPERLENPRVAGHGSRLVVAGVREAGGVGLFHTNIGEPAGGVSPASLSAGVVTGGTTGEIVRRDAYLAAAEKGDLEMRHLRDASREELRKLGRDLTPEEREAWE